MQIVLNGATTDIQEGTSISDMLAELGFQDQLIAVEVNQEVIPRGEHISFILSSRDVVEIIHAVGGG